MVVELAQDVMETEASHPDCDHDCKEEDAMDQSGGDDLHVRVETVVQGVPQMAVNNKILVDSPEYIQTDDHGGGGVGGVEDENARPGNP